MKLLVGVVFSGLIFGCAAAGAQQHQNCSGPQLGTWKLQSFAALDLATGQKSDTLGSKPTGYLSYGPDCRMQVILIRDERKAPAGSVPTDAERIALYDGVIAYAGAYSIDGDKVSHHIDASWNQSWTGTTQVRQFRIDGKSLYIQTLPAKSPQTGKETVFELVFAKVE